MSDPQAPVQGDLWRRARVHPALPPDGWIDWAEHLAVFEFYAARYGREQSAERIAERGGFGYREIELFTGAAPKTWRPREHD